jgi:two-component system response regulator YesN
MAKMKMIANKGFLQIFFALLLVVILMFVSNYMVYKNSLTSIYNQVSENNKLVVKNMIRSFDDSFKDINDIIYSIQMLPYHTWDKDDDGILNMHEVYMSQKDIRSLVSSFDYIEEVVVFNNNSNLAITAAGTIQIQELFRQKYSNKTYNADFWKSTASTTHPLRVFPADGYTEAGSSGDTQRKLLIVLGSNQLSNQNVLVFLNTDKLLEHVNQAAMMQGTSLIVMDQNRNVILNTEEKWDLVEVLNDLNVGMGQEATLKKKNYEYNLFKSDYNDFIYMNKSPYKFVNMKSVADANRQIIMIAIICAIMLSALLSLYLYKPVRNILKLVGGWDQGRADFRNIFTGIAKIQQENESFKTQMDVIHSEMRKSAFLNALGDYSHSRETEQRLQQYFTDFFQSTYFLMAAIHLRPSEGSEHLNIEEVTQTIQNRLREQLGKAAVFHSSNLRFVVWIGIGQQTEREQTVKQLRGYVLQEKTETWKGIIVLAAVSRLYPTLAENCHKAYQDLTHCLVYRNIHSEDPIIDFESIQFTWKVYYPLDEIEKSSHFLVSGNEAECIGIIKEIFAVNVERRIHHNQLVPVAKTIFYYLLKHLEMSDIDSKEIHALELEFNAEVDAAFHYTGIRNALIQAVKVIADKIKNGQRRKLNPAFIARYIEDHYMGNLHLDHMAVKMETSPKYFSNYFKKTFGVNFVDYLNKVRLSHAKELLKNTDMPVSEISEKTGYLNSSTFTSTYKKYFGSSPSEFRKIASTDQLPSGRKNNESHRR